MFALPVTKSYKPGIVLTLRPALVHISIVSQTLERSAEDIATITPKALFLLLIEAKKKFINPSKNLSLI